MAYRIELLPSAVRDLARLDKTNQQRVGRKISDLADNPRPSGSKKLRDQGNRWRLRIGDFRVVYDIRDELILILILKIGHRRDVYRRR